MKGFEAEFGKWVIRRRWWILAVTVAAAAAASFGIGGLEIDSDSRIFFSEENPQLNALNELEHTYVEDDHVYFAIAPQDDDVFTKRTLKMVAEMTEACWQTPHSTRVQSITNFPHLNVDGDELAVEPLVNRSGLIAVEPETAKSITLAQPLLVNNLVSQSADVTAISVATVRPGKSRREVEEVAEFAYQLADEFRARYPDVDIYVTGSIIADYAFGQISKKDLLTLIPAMLVVLAAIVGIALRSFVGTVATLAVIVVSMATALGIAGWLGVSLNAASGIAPTIILTLAVADSVHILTTMFKRTRLGLSAAEAVVESLSINLGAIFLTSITTAIGFLSMNFSDAPPFRDLGNIVAIGVTAAFLYSVLSLPALLSLLPVTDRSSAMQAPQRYCQLPADLAIARPRLMLVLMGGSTFLLAAGALRLKTNDNLVRYFEKDNDFRVATEFVEHKLRGWHAIEYSLRSGERGGINDPDYLATVDGFARWYRRQPKVVEVSVFTDVMKVVNRAMHGGDPNFYRIPDNRELAAQYLLLYELSLPYGYDLNNRIDVDKSATMMAVSLKDMTARQILEIESRARRWLQDNAPASMFTRGTGISVVWAHITDRNCRNMLWAALVAIVLISAILIVALRSVKIGLISLVPNLAPPLVAFGIWGYIDGEFGLGLSIIVSMTIGIVVDDTVHFLSKFLRSRRQQNATAAEAIRYAFNTVGTAMWVTTAALVAGFLVLTLSAYRMNSDMGLMAAMTMVLALAMDFLLLPALLLKMEKRTDAVNSLDVDTYDDVGSAGDSGCARTQG